MKNVSVAVVKNDRPSLGLITEYISKVFLQYGSVKPKIRGFLDPLKALDYFDHNHCDIVFSDAELCGMDGLIFMRTLQKRDPKTHLVITTTHEEYVVQAVQMHISLSGYLALPITVAKLKEQLDSILNQINITDASQGDTPVHQQ